MAQLNDLIVTGNSRFINKTYTSTADVGCITASSAAGATEHSAGTTGQALVSDGDSVYWGNPQHADTTDEAQHATSAAALDDTEFIEDNEPYLFRTAPHEAGNRVYENAIVGGSVAWNQLIGVSSTATATNNGITYTNNNDGSFTINGTSTNPARINYSLGTISASKMIIGHKYLLCGCKDSQAKLAIYGLGNANPNGSILNYTGDANTSYRLDSSVAISATYNNLVIKPQLFDLTLMFGSTIADYIYTLEQSEAGSGIAWLKSYGFFGKDYYDYDAGSIKSVQTSAKKVVGFNQWDEQWELGNINDTTGENLINSNLIRSKNVNKAIPNTIYYANIANYNAHIFCYDDSYNYLGYLDRSGNGTFTTLPNTAYFRFRMNTAYGTIYNNDICINISDSERNGEYESYKEYEYDLSGERKVTRNYNIITFDGSEDEGWTLFTNSGLNQLYVTKTNVISSANEIMTVCDKFRSISISDRANNYNTCYTGSSGICFNVENYTVETWKQWLSSNPVTVVYKIKEPYEEIVTNPELYGFYKLDANNKLYCDGDICNDFVSPQWVSNWGTEEFINTREVPIPVGHNSRYPKTDNYKLASIPAPPGGAGDYIVHTDEYGESVYQQASDVKVNYAGTADLGKRRIFIEGTQTTGTKTGLWEGDASAYFQSSADLTDGQEITYWLPLPTTGSATLNLKFGDGTSSGAVNCYYSSTTRLSTHYGQGNAIHLTYRKNVKIPSTGSTTYTGWWADANYYSDSNTVSSLRGDYTYLVAGANVGVQNNSLIARDSNGKYSSFTSNSTTATSKIANRTDYFDISKIFYYSGSVAASGNMASGALYWACANLNSRYTINASNLTARKPLYLKFDANESTVSSITGATCYKLGGTANDDYWSQTLPASADGMIYVEVSRGVRDYRVDLAEDQHYYQYTDKLYEYDSWNSNVTRDTVLGAISTGASWTGNYSFAEGGYTRALGDYSHAEGAGTRAANSGSHSEGSGTYANASYSHAEGNGTTAAGEASHAEGYATNASGSTAAHAEGRLTLASGTISHAEGNLTTASNNCSHAEGAQTVASGICSHAEGDHTTASGNYSHAEGAQTLAYNPYSHAGGYYTIANKNYQTAIGKFNATVDSALFIVGNGSSAADTDIVRSNAMYVTTAGGIAGGDNSTVSGSYSFAWGSSVIASSTATHAEGYQTTASHFYSHAEGSYTKANGQSSHAEGENTTASGQNSHAEGQQSLASAQCSHVEGMGTRATTFCAHAGGENSTASGEASYAGGGWIIANKDFQTAIGKFNATVDDALFIIGNGKIVSGTVTRSNAMYVTTAGNVNCVSVTQTSDERLKENINPLTTTDKSILDALEPKQFTLKQDERHQLHYGFIAQDVERQINALGFPTSSHSLIDIADNEEAYYSLNYTELIPLLVQRVKELEQRVAQLENK